MWFETLMTYFGFICFGALIGRLLSIPLGRFLWWAYSKYLDRKGY